MKKTLLIVTLLLIVSLGFSWDLLRQTQFPTNFYALDRVNTTMWAAGYVGGFAKSIDNGQTWTFLPSPAFDAVTPAYKDINDIDFFDEQHGVIACNDGLVAVTTNGGSDWTTCPQVLTQFGADDVMACYYASDGKIWVVGWAGKIAYSSDFGANWTAQASGITDQIYSVSMNSAGVGFCTVNNGSPDQAKLLTTTDFGTNWAIQNLTITANPHIYKVRQYGSTVVLAGGSGYIGVSTDNGANWTHHNGAGGSSTNMQDIVLDGNTGYAGGWNGVLLKTTTAWATFETVTNDFGLYFEGLNILPNGNIITAGWNGAIAISADQGVTWTDKVMSALDIFSAKAVDTDTWYLAGDKGYLLKTTDAGQSFTRLHIPGNIDPYYAVYFKNAQEGWVTGKTLGKIFHTVNGGGTWDTVTIPGVTAAKTYTEIYFVSDLIGYAVGVPGKTAKTIDGGLTWTPQPDVGITSSLNLTSAYFKTESLGFAGSSAGQLFITQDGCQTWTPIVVGTATATIRDVWFKDDMHGVLVNSVGEIFYTTTGGMTAGSWTAGTESCLDDMNGVWCDANGYFWAAGYSSDNTSTNIGNTWSVIKSVNNGAAWTQESFPALTFNATRFMGITGATGKLIAYGKNNLLIGAVNGGITPPTGATNLFFSEYVEGTSSNKALEIFNGTGQPVDLSQYSVNLATNGSPWGSTPLLLTGTLANNEVYVIVNASASAAILAQADITSTVTYYNGNDAVGLFQGTTLIDVIGVMGENPGTTPPHGWSIAGVVDATQEYTLIRKPTVVSPTTDWALSAGTNADNSQWIVNPRDYIGDLGMHTFNPNTGPSAATPVITPAGGVYTSPINVTITTTTPNAVIYYTSNGSVPTTSSTVYTTPIAVTATTTIKAIAAAAGMDNSFVASATYTFPVVVANLAALRAQPADNSTLYYVSGEIIMTFKQTFRNQKWFQDSTAGIMTDDLPNVLSTAFNVGDGITGLVGKLYDYAAGGMLEFIPTANIATPSSTGNQIVPMVVTLNDLATGFETYESRLVQVLYSSFTTPTGNFTNGAAYPISDSTGTFHFRATFYDVNYIGQPLPTTPVHITGIPNSTAAGNFITARNAEDIQLPSGNVATPTFNPVAGIYLTPIQVTISTATTNAVIYYTTDGSVPTVQSSVYINPININTNTTLKAIAVLGAESSYVATALYSFPVEVANLAALRQQPTGLTVYKVTGEVVMTFKQTNRNQKFIQDNTGAVMIDDAAGIITNTLNIGDGITGLIGTLTEFGGMLEFIPTINPPEATSTGNVIIPQNISFVDFSNNFEQYESELIQFSSVSFTTADTIFATGITYPLSDGTNTVNFRTNFYNVNYIGTSIPTAPITIVGIANSRTDGNYITSRSLADFTQSTFDPPTNLSYLIQNTHNVVLTWIPGPIPIKGKNSRNWDNLTALRVYRNNNLIATITDFTAYEPAIYTDNDVPGGDYSYYVTNVYFNQFESNYSNTVNVNIVADEDPIIPATITSLAGNYPNPFNPTTTINYSVKTPSPVTITIYNLKGEKVRTLVNATKGNGNYKAIWNGNDDNGKPVSSGVYLYRMQAGNYSSVRRMMLMK